MSHSNFLIISPRPGRAAPGKEEASHLVKNSKKLARLFPYLCAFSAVLKWDLFGREVQTGGRKLASGAPVALSVGDFCGASRFARVASVHVLCW